MMSKDLNNVLKRGFNMTLNDNISHKTAICNIKVVYWIYKMFRSMRDGHIVWLNEGGCIQYGYIIINLNSLSLKSVWMLLENESITIRINEMKLCVYNVSYV
jgi:hypothetical protein